MTDGKKSSSSNGDSLENDTGFILVEIVSALNVPNVDHRKEPDPFVVVEMAGRPVHQTDVLYNTHFPIWSLECGSLFLLETAKDKYVQFILKEYESWRQDPTLGTLELSLEEMKQGKGNRREFPLIVPQHVLDLTQSIKATIVRKVSFQQSPTSIIASVAYCRISTTRLGWFCDSNQPRPRMLNSFKHFRRKKPESMPTKRICRRFPQRNNNRQCKASDCRPLTSGGPIYLHARNPVPERTVWTPFW